MSETGRTIGFIGLGIMGLPMAANLVRGGLRVRGFARSEQTRAAATEQGIEAVTSTAAAVDGAEIVITMLPDSPDVVEVGLGEAGVLSRAATGVLWIDMSTIDPDTARDLHSRSTAQGVRFLDAPVSGGEAGAIDGQLSIMVGGEAVVLESARDLLALLGTTIVHVGPAGSGQVVKAANQIVVAGNIQVLAEALVFLRGQDADLERALEVIGGGLAGSTVLQRKRTSLLAGDFRPGFRARLHHKDLGIVQRSARAAGVGLPATALVTQLMQTLVTRGDGDLDHSALYAQTAELNGMKLDGGAA